MKSINTIDLTKLHTDEVMGYLAQVAEKSSLVTIAGDQEVISAFVQAVKEFEAALKPNIKNSFTQSRKEADEVTDKLWSGMRMYTEAMTYHSNDVVQKTAEKIETIIDKYGRITKMSYKEQYPNLNGLLNELKGLPADDIANISLAQWIEPLSNAYDTFMAISADKITEDSEKEVGLVEQTRDAAQDAYSAMVTRINAGASYNGDVPYAEFIDTVNVLVDEYKAHIASRKTRNAKKSW